MPWMNRPASSIGIWVAMAAMTQPMPYISAAPSSTRLSVRRWHNTADAAPAMMAPTWYSEIIQLT